jgi:single-strand DNA-binding protein
MLNKVILMGRLVRDPELNQTANGIAVCKFTVAVNRPYQKDKEQQADFINVTAWRGTAEFVSKYFSKGSIIIVEGKLQNNDYTDKDGVKHYSMVVQADNVNFGGGKSENTSQAEAELKQNLKSIEGTSDSPIGVGDLSEFEEILSDGETPF